jgi:hypothetical protein
MVHKHKSQDKFVVVYEEEDIVGHGSDEETEETYPIKKIFIRQKEFTKWGDVQKFNEDMSVWHGEEGTRFKVLSMFDKKTREKLYA